MAGVRGSKFFTFRLGQGQAKGAVRAAPVVDGQAPPTEGDFGIITSGKGQRAANLMGAHRRAVPLRRSIADVLGVEYPSWSSAC